MLSPSTTAQNKPEPTYAEHGYPTLGLYEELPPMPVDEGAYAEVHPNPKSEGSASGGKASTTGGKWVATPRSKVRLDKQTSEASWFLTGMPREQIRWWAKQLLELGPVGGYIVREPDSQPDAFALVVKTGPSKTKNYLIKCETQDGVQTFRLGGVRSRSLYRLCEKLAMVKSQLAAPLLPQFFLNKKAALKKAMKDGEQVPGLAASARSGAGVDKKHGSRTSESKLDSIAAGLPPKSTAVDATFNFISSGSEKPPSALSVAIPKPSTSGVQAALQAEARVAAELRQLQQEVSAKPASKPRSVKTVAAGPVSTATGEAAKSLTARPSVSKKKTPPPVSKRKPSIASVHPTKAAGENRSPSSLENITQPQPPATVEMRTVPGRPLSPTSALLASIGSVNSLIESSHNDGENVMDVSREMTQSSIQVLPPPLPLELLSMSSLPLPPSEMLISPDDTTPTLANGSQQQFTFDVPADYDVDADSEADAPLPVSGQDNKCDINKNTECFFVIEESQGKMGQLVLQEGDEVMAEPGTQETASGLIWVVVKDNGKAGWYPRRCLATEDEIYEQYVADTSAISTDIPVPPSQCTPTQLSPIPMSPAEVGNNTSTAHFYPTDGDSESSASATGIMIDKLLAESVDALDFSEVGDILHQDSSSAPASVRTVTRPESGYYGFAGLGLENEGQHKVVKNTSIHEECENSSAESDEVLQLKSTGKFTRNPSGPYGFSLSASKARETAKKHTPQRKASGAYGFGAPDAARRAVEAASNAPITSKPPPPPPRRGSALSRPSPKSGRRANLFGPNDLGCRVTVTGVGHGTLRFSGEHKVLRKQVCGIELDAPTGEHDGSVGGHLYWLGKPGHGVLVAPELVERGASTSVQWDIGSDDGFDC